MMYGRSADFSPRSRTHSILCAYLIVTRSFEWNQQINKAQVNISESLPSCLINIIVDNIYITTDIYIYIKEGSLEVRKIE